MKKVLKCKANYQHATQYTRSNTAAMYIKFRYFHAPGVAVFLSQVCKLQLPTLERITYTY